MAAARREAVLSLRLIDNVSKAANGIVASLGRLNAATKAITSASLAPAHALGGMAKGFRNASLGLTTISMPIAMAATNAGRAVFEYEKMGNTMQAVGLLSDEQREKLEAYGKELNFRYPFINSQILEAAAELLKSGMTFDQAIGSLESTLNTSLAGDIGLGNTADIMTNIAQAMRLTADTAEETGAIMSRISDTLAYAATNSNSSIEEMAIVFRYVAPLAAATGMSLEELAAASMVLANNGIKGSNAGTGLRFAIGRMLKPSKEAVKALDLLNIEVADFVKGARDISASEVVASLAMDGIDAGGMEGAIQGVLDDPVLKRSPARLVSRLSQLIGDELEAGGLIDSKALSDSLSEILTVLGTEVDLKGLIRELRNNPMAEALVPTIFGARHGPKILALMAQDMEVVLDDLVKNYQGSADKMSRIRMKGFVGDIRQLEAALDNLRMTVSDSGVLTTVARGAREMTAAIMKLGQANPRLLELGTYGALALGALAPLGFAISGVASALTFIANPLTLVAGGLAYLAARNWDAVTSFFGALGSTIRSNLSPEVLGLVDSAGEKLRAFVDWMSETRTFDLSWSKAAREWGESIAAGVNTAYDAVSAFVGSNFATEYFDGFATAFRNMGDAAKWLAESIGSLGEAARPLVDLLNTDAAGSLGSLMGQLAGYGLGMALAAAGIGMVLRPLRGLASIVATLSGLKLAWGVTRFVARIAAMGARAAGITSLATAIGGLAASLLKLSGAMLLRGALGKIGLAGAALWGVGEVGMRAHGRGPESEGYADRVDESVARVKMDELQGALNDATESWPQAAYRAINAYTDTLAAGGAQAEAEAARIGQQIETELSVTGHPDVNTERLERAIGLARELAGVMRSLGSASTGTAPVAPQSAPVAGARRRGGPVSRGLTYLVGEDGPELFTPNRSGNIVPNGKLGGKASVVFQNTFHLHGNGSGKSQADELIRELDRQLNRAAQIAFGSGNAYGEA